MSGFGTLLPAAAVGFGLLLPKPKRGFFSAGTTQPIIKMAQAYIEERHTSELEITEHPVEQGAAIADHAFVKPVVVSIVYGWSNSPSQPAGLVSSAVALGQALTGQTGALIASVFSAAQAAQSLLGGNDPGQVKAVYESLIALQKSRVLFDLYTGKRSYKNMLIQSIQETTELNTENCLILTITCRQVIIAITQTVTVGGDTSVLASPEQNAAVTDEGSRSLVESTSLIPPPDALTAPLAGLSANFSGVLKTFSNLPSSLAGVIPGAMGQLSGVVTGAMASVNNVLSNILPPFVCPVTSGVPQSFSLPDLGTTGISAVLKNSMTAMQTTLAASLPRIIDATQQLPSLTTLLGPTVVDQFRQQLSVTPALIESSLRQSQEALLRNPL